MKLHIITIGEPKLDYAKRGWQEYWTRLQHYHQVRVTHLADKWADNPAKVLETAGNGYKVVLEIEGKAFSSPGLANWLDKISLNGQELCFIIGGPNGLPAAVREAADVQWSFGRLTLPHDLAMVTLLEALYRASTINAGQPYHR